jgi:hypothetical protein
MQLKKSLLALLLVLSTVPAVAQTTVNYVPTLGAMFTSSDGSGSRGTFTPLTGSGGSTVAYVPQPIGMMYSTDGTGNPGTWAFCTATTCGGGGSSITLTTLGSSGAATLTGSVLNIPVYSSSGGITSINGNTAAAQTIVNTDGSITVVSSAGVTTLSANNTGSGTVAGQAAGVIPLGTAATAIGAQSHLDDGNTTVNTITSTEPIVVTPPSGDAGLISVPGNTTIQALPANTFSIHGPPSASFTSWAIQFMSAYPTSACILHIGAGVSGTGGYTSQATCSAVNLAGADVTGVLPVANLPSSVSITRITFGNSAAAGTAVSTGTTPSFTSPFAGTIISATLTGTLSASTCSAVIDVWKTSAAIPTVANTITASALPTLSTATYAQNTTLTGWTKTIAKNDVLMANVQSATCDNWNLVLAVQQ